MSSTEEHDKKYTIPLTATVLDISNSFDKELNDDIINLIIERCWNQVALEKLNSVITNTYFFTTVCAANSTKNYSKLLRYQFWNSSLRFGDVISHDDNQSLNKLIIPVHINNNHWSLLIYSIPEKTFYYLDSLLVASGNNQEDIKLLLPRQLTLFFNVWMELSPKNTDEISLEIVSVPQQNDLFNCGVFMLGFIRFIMSNALAHKPNWFEGIDRFKINPRDVRRGIQKSVQKFVS